MKTYYMIPNASNPPPGFKVWYASWSKAKPTVTWSEVGPNFVPDNQTTWIVGVVHSDQDPGGGAVPLGTGGKQVPPPPLPLGADDVGISGFQKAFKRWLTARSA